jgi:transposase
MALAREQIKRLEQLLEQQQQPFSHQLTRLQTVPSVGPIVALKAVAVFSDVRWPGLDGPSSWAV